MTLPKLLGIVALLLFGIIGVIALFKEPAQKVSTPQIAVPLEVELDQQIQVAMPAAVPPSTPVLVEAQEESIRETVELPDADRIDEFFRLEEPKLPIVETITYKSKVPWLKGRPAWLCDYAGHHGTSRHFIARSLNGKPDYLKQDLHEGARFNVLRQDLNYEFALVVDTSRCKMWFYYIDLDTSQKVLLKTYRVGLGRVDGSKPSGLLTPIGKYTLGDRIATYQPDSTGTHLGNKIVMVTVFGTRWIPFESEVGACTAPANGFGIHGTPWVSSPKGELVDQTDSIGKYESDGCIRLATPDIEELFAIIISKPATIEIVRDFSESSLAENAK